MDNRREASRAYVNRRDVNGGNVYRRDVNRGNVYRREANGAYTNRGYVLENRGRRGFERKRRRQRKRKLIRRMLSTAFLLINLFLFLYLLGRLREFDQEMKRAAIAMQDQTIAAPGYSQDAESGQKGEGSYADRCGLDKVDAPRERTEREVLERLSELGRDDAVIQAIYENSAAYPSKMLEALANNPEMADFVSGYQTAGNSAPGGLTEEEKSQSYPLFLQWDPRWGYESYGDGSVVGLAGCGPTCLSMVLYSLTGKEELTPDRVAAYSMANGYYVSGTGTAWALLEEVPPLYGVYSDKLENSEWAMRAELDQGHPLILSVGPGDFTVNGHFIVVYGYDKDGFLVNDPNCVARSRQSWPYTALERQIKSIWAFS